MVQKIEWLARNRSQGMKGLGMAALLLCCGSLRAQTEITLYPYNQSMATGHVTPAGVMKTGLLQNIRKSDNHGFMCFNTSPIPAGARVQAARLETSLSCWSDSWPGGVVETGQLRVLPGDPRFIPLTIADIKAGKQIGYMDWTVPNILLNAPFVGALDTAGLALLQRRLGQSFYFGVEPSQTSEDVRCIVGYEGSFGKPKPKLIITYELGESPKKPRADFKANRTNIFTGDTVQFADLSDYNPNNWTWDFGDSTFSTLQHPQKMYPDSGDFSVKMVVKNAQGKDSLIRTAYIKVTPRPPYPEAWFVSDLQLVRVGDTVQFTDSSVNNPDAWYWDFMHNRYPGVYVDTLQNPRFAFPDTGKFSVRLAITNPFGTDTHTRQQYIQVVEGFAPLAGFDHAMNGLRVNFIDTSLWDPDVWHWDFMADKAPGVHVSNLQNPAFEYDSISTYRVCLRAENQFGKDSNCRTIDLDTTGTWFWSSRSEDDLRVYPNPTRGRIVVQWTGRDPHFRYAHAYDQRGRKVRSWYGREVRPEHPWKNSIELSLEGLDNGVYILRFRGRYGYQNLKVVLEN